LQDYFLLHACMPNNGTVLIITTLIGKENSEKFQENTNRDQPDAGGNARAAALIAQDPVHHVYQQGVGPAADFLVELVA